MTFAVGLSAEADETFPTLEVSGITYTNVTVTTVTATDIYFTYDGGMGNAKLENLSPELQEHFHYNATAAAASNQQQALANAQYLASQPPQWGTDLPAALDAARSENKCVLMDFTGSDWCPWCMKLDQEVFSTPQFADYARNKLVLVKLDFPHNVPQSDALKQANAELASRFKVDGYPTCILLDSSGKELWRQVGYAEGDPAAFIARFSGFIPMAVGRTTTRPTTQVASVVAPIVARLDAALAATPKFGRKWYLIAGIPAGLVLLTLIVRGVSKG